MFFKKNKKATKVAEEPTTKIRTLVLTKDGITTTEIVDTDYLRWFVESGKDLDYDNVEVIK